MGKSTSDNGKAPASLEDFNSSLMQEGGGPAPAASKPKKQNNEFALGSQEFRKGQAGKAPSLEDLNNAILEEDKKKSGVSGESSPVSSSGESGTPSTSPSGGTIKAEDNIPDNRNSPSGTPDENMDFLSSFEKDLISHLPQNVNIAGKKVDLKSLDTYPGPYAQQIKDTHKKDIIERIHQNNVNDEDSLLLAQLTDSDPQAVKESINTPARFQKRLALSTINTDLTKSVKTTPEQFMKFRKDVLGGDGKALASYYQGRSLELSKQIDAVERQMSQFESPLYQSTDPLFEIASNEKTVKANDGSYDKLKQQRDTLKENLASLNEATGTLLSTQLASSFDKPDRMGQIHAFDFKKAAEIGAKVKEVFNPNAAANDIKRLAAGYPLPQQTEFENTKYGVEARIMHLATKMEGAREKLKETPNDPTTIDNFNGMVGEYNNLVTQYPKLSDKFPEVRREELTQGLVDLYHKRVEAERSARTATDAGTIAAGLGGGWGAVRNLLGHILNETPDENAIKALADQTGLSVAEINKLNDKKGFWDWNFGKRENIRTEGLLSSVASGFYGGVRNMQKFSNRVLGEGTPLEKTIRNEAISKDINENRRTPTADQLYQPEVKIDLDKYDKAGNLNPNFLRQRLNEDAGKLNLNPASFVHTVGDTFGQMALYAGAGRLLGAGIEKAMTSTALKAIGAEYGAASELGQFANASRLAGIGRQAERFGELAGTFGSGFAISYDDYYTSAAQHTQDENKRNLSASVNASIEGLSELIFPDVDVAKALRGKKNLFPIFDKLLKAEGGVVNASLIKAYTGQLAKGVGIANIEGLEEVFSTVGTALSDNIILNKEIDTSKLAEQAKQAYVTTMIGMIPNGVGAAISGSAKLKKDGLFEAGNEPTKYIDYVNKLVTKGKIDQNEANKRIQTINTMADIVSGIPAKGPDGQPYSPDEKVEIAAQEFRIRKNQQLKTTSTVTAVKSAAEADTKEAQKVQEAIVTKAPLYKLNGKEVTKDKIEEILNPVGMPEISKNTIEITNDSSLQGRLQEGINQDKFGIEVSTNGLTTISSPKIKADETGNQSEQAKAGETSGAEEAGKQAESGSTQASPGEQANVVADQNQGAEETASDFTTEDLPEAVRKKLPVKKQENVESNTDQNKFPAGAQEKPRERTEATGNDVTPDTKRREEAANAWLKAIAGNDTEAQGNAQEELLRQTNTAQGQEGQPVLDGTNVGGTEIRTPGDNGANIGSQVTSDGTRSSQESQRIGQQAWELGSINQQGTQQTSLAPGDQGKTEAGRLQKLSPVERDLVEKVAALPSMPDDENKASLIRSMQELLSQSSSDQEKTNEIVNLIAEQLKNKKDVSIQKSKPEKVGIRKQTGNGEEVGQGNQINQEPAGKSEKVSKEEVELTPLEKAIDALGKVQMNSMEQGMFGSDPAGMVEYIGTQAAGVMRDLAGNISLVEPGYNAAVSYYGKEAVDAAIDALPENIKNFIESKRAVTGEEDPAKMQPLTTEEIQELNNELAADGITVNDIVEFESQNVKPIIDATTNIPNSAIVSEEGNGNTDNAPTIQEALSQPKDVNGTSLPKDPTGETIKDPLVGKPESEYTKEELLKKKLEEKKDKFFAKMKAARGRLNAIGPLDPETIAAGVELLATYAEMGIHKLSTIVKDFIKTYGNESLDTDDLYAMRGVYGYYRENSTKEERALMESTDEVDDFFVNDLPLLRTEKRDSPELVEPTEESNALSELSTMREFVDFVGNSIDNNRKLNIIDMRKEAARIGLKYNGDTHLQELAELAVVEKTREVAQGGDLDDEKLEEIIKIYERQPSFNQRSSERIEKQQYSTPAPIAFIGGMWIGKIGPESVLEPSAGNGLLTTYFDPSIVHVNEIDQVRLVNLVQQGFAQVTEQDATKPFVVAKKDGVITNPPFGGAAAKSYDGYKVSGLDEQMTINALDAMKDNGRAAIIIGGHTKWDDKGRIAGDRTFFNYLYNHYNVADVININGDLYAKQGTKFPIRMILIDGRKKTPSGAAALKNDLQALQVNNYHDLFERVNNIEPIDHELQNDLQPTVDEQSGSGQTVHGGSAGQSESEQPGTNTGQVSSGQVGRTDTASVGEQRTPAGDNSGSVGVGSNRGNVSQGTNAGINEQRPLSELEAKIPESTEQTTDSANPEPAGSGESISRDRPVELDRKLDSEQLAQEKIPYTPASQGKSLELVIPTQMASEAQRTLSAIDQDKNGVDNFVRDRLGYKNKEELYKALSAEQIDAVAIAISNIERGEGMIVGDMTGTGKGRIAASIVRYAVKQGLKPIFLTEKPNLFSDLYRDMVATGSGHLRPFLINDKTDKNDPTIKDGDVVIHKSLSAPKKKAIFESLALPADFDFVMGTYSQFTSSDAKRPSIKKGFLRALAEGNILIMDESHNVSGDSNSGAYFQDVMSALRGVLFLSATFAKRPDNMPVYALKTAMSEANMSKEELIAAIQKGGVALQEVVSAQLVESGQMLRRERNFEGVTTQFDMLENLQEEHRKTADTVTEIMRDIAAFEREYVQPLFNSMDDALAGIGGTAGERKGVSEMGISNTPFASKIFNLVDQLLFAIKADSVADMAIEEIKNGRKPVIAFKSTMESFLNSIDAKVGETLGKADFSLTLKRGLDGVFRYTETNDRGEKVKKTLSLADLPPEALNQYKFLVQKIQNASVGISISPIDQIHYKLKKAGLTSAEITGRTLQLEIQDDGSAKVINRAETNVNNMVQAFQHGRLDVIMINASGATGLSLHDSMDPKQSTDGRQRVMLTTQLELDINKEIQKRGRIDRVGQKLRGAFRYIVSSIPAEARMLMMFKAKVRSLDANTTSSQKSQSTELDFPDFLNKHGDVVVTQYLIDHPEINELMGDPLKLVSMSDESKADLGESGVDGAARKITGRVAILDSQSQERFYQEVSKKYKEYVDFLDSNNANDLEVKVMPLRSTTTQKTVLIVGKGGKSPFGTDSFLEKMEIDNLKKPLTSKELKAEVDEALAGRDPLDIPDQMEADFDKYFRARMDEERASIRDKWNKRRAEIPDMAVRQARKLKTEDPQTIAQIINTITEDMQRSEEVETGKFVTKEEGLQQMINRRFNFFVVGKVYNVPTDIRIETNTAYVPGVFLGFTIKDSTRNKYAPSNITMRFATTDSRRVVIVPLSKTGFLDGTVAASYHMSDLTKQRVMDAWDKMESRKDRSTRYMVTGNLLQGFGAAGNGQLVSYTTDSGELRKGILLNDEYSPVGQKVRVPVTKMADYLRKNRDAVITTSDQAVAISAVGRGFMIEVPASKSAGGKYFLDPELRALVEDNNFRTSGGKMVSIFSPSKLDAVLKLLGEKFGASVDVDKDLVPSDLLEGNVDKNAVDSVIAKLNAMKLKDDFLGAMLGIPVTIWNGAIEIVKTAVTLGNNLYAGIKRAEDFVRENWKKGTFNPAEFSREIRAELITQGITPGEMAPETIRLAKKSIKAIEKGATIKEEADKLARFYDGLKRILSPEDAKILDAEHQMFVDYLNLNAIEIPEGASKSAGEAYDKAKAMAADIETNNLKYEPTTFWQKAWNKAAKAVDPILSHPLNKALNVLNIVQDKTVGTAKNVVGEGFKTVAEKALQSKNVYVRNVGGALNGLFANMGKTTTDINRGEQFKGEASKKSVADAFHISENIRKMVDNNVQSLVSIDQVLDVEPYQYLKDMTRDEFGKALKSEEPDLSDADINDEYMKMRQHFGFDQKDHKFKTVDDLTPEERSAYEMIRTIYDFIHETNFAMGLLPKEKYWRNYGKYSARLYDTYELPEELAKAMNGSPTKMDVEGFMKRDNLTDWKALHKLGDPVFPMAKRLQQTLQNKAVIDYANYLIAAKGNAISDYERPGYIKLSGYGYGPLSNKWVREDVAEDFKGYFFHQKQMQHFYEFLKSYDRMPIRQFYKKFFTVYNPTVHVGNILSNSFFGWASGINPIRLNMNIPYAIDQIKRYGEDYRLLLGEGVMGSDIALNDLNKKIVDTFQEQTPPDTGMPPVANSFIPTRVIKSVARTAQDFYGATDDVYKLAAYHSLRQLGYDHAKAADRVKQGFQNYNRVGKTYDVASKLPVVGPPFGKFAGDLARIAGTAITTRPLQTMAVLASLRYMGVLLSQMAGESDEERRKRANRPGATSLPVPRSFPEWMGGGTEGGISLSFANPWAKGQEVNIAKYLSPVFTYNSFDGDNTGSFLQKFSPLPIETGDRFSFSPNGSYPIISKNANDPVLAPIVQVLANSDFRGVPILDPKENLYRKSTLSPEERRDNAIRFLARAHVPYGGYADDFLRAIKGDPDYYNRQLTPGQVVARFLGYKTLPFAGEQYDKALNNRLKYWGSVFYEESKPIKTLERELEEGKITQKVFDERLAAKLEKQAEIISEANKDIGRMTNNPEFFKSGEDLRVIRSDNAASSRRNVQKFVTE